FVASGGGDGTVSWASGRLERVRTWFLEDTAHDALCVQQRAFPAYLELLQLGTTTRLPATPPLRLRAGGEATESFLLPPLPPADHLPAQEDLHSLGFGGGLAAHDLDQSPPVPTIEVCIRHGDL